MKKLILTVMLAVLSATTLFAQPTELKIKPWTGAKPQFTAQASPFAANSAATSAQAPQFTVEPVAFSTEVTPAVSTEPQKAPAPEPSASRRSSSRASVWGEWYDVSSGYLGANVVFSNLFGTPVEGRATLQRRDDKNNPESSQLRIKGLFGDYDVAFDWNPKTCEFFVNKFVFEGLANPYAPGVVPELESCGGMWFPRSQFYITFFFVVFEGDCGYNVPMVYTPDNCADSYIGGTMDTDNPNATVRNFNITRVGTDVAKIKYAAVYSPGAQFEKDGHNYYLPSAITGGVEGLDVKTVSTASLPQALTVNTDKTGTWYMALIIYDADDQPIGFGGMYIYAALREFDKWKTIGNAKYTDNLIAGLFENYKYAFPDYEIPEWASDLTWEVELQQSKENPGLYRLVNPYTCAASPCRDFSLKYSEEYSMNVTLDRAYDFYLFFNVENPEAPWAVNSATGMRLNGSHLHFSSPQGVVSTNQGLAPADYDLSCLEYDPAGCIRSYSDPEMVVLFPGYLDYTLRMTFDERNVTISYLGEAVKEVRYTVRDGIVNDDASLAEMYAILAANTSGEYTICKTDKAGLLDLSAFNLEPEKEYTLYACSIDANGKAQKTMWMGLYIQRHVFKYYGMGEFSDPLLSSGDFIQIELYTADDAPGHYFIRNPYAGYVPYSFSSYLDLDCSNPARVDMPLYKTGLTYTGHGEAYLATRGFLKEYLGLQTSDADYGTFDNLEVVIPASALIMQFTPYDESGYTVSGDLRLRLPGFVSYEYDLDLTDSRWSVYGMAPAVEEIVYTLTSKDAMTPDELFAAMANGTIETASVKELGEMPLTMFNPEPLNYYTLGTASVSTGADGQKVFHEFRSATFFYDLPVSYMGKGKYSDALFYMFTEVFTVNFDDITPLMAEREVELYTSSELPGAVLVKDPLRVLREANNCSYVASQYLPIVISDPERVYIKDGIFGSLDVINAQYNDVRFSSAASYFMAQGKKPEEIPAEYYGTLRGTVVEIPANIILWGDYLVTGNGENPPYQALRLVLPDDYAGVEAVEADASAAPAEYFDLSGRRVERPQAGIYIVRRAGKVTKEYIR